MLTIDDILKKYFFGHGYFYLYVCKFPLTFIAQWNCNLILNDENTP